MLSALSIQCETSLTVIEHICHKMLIVVLCWEGREATKTVCIIPKQKFLVFPVSITMSITHSMADDNRCNLIGFVLSFGSVRFILPSSHTIPPKFPFKCFYCMYVIDSKTHYLSPNYQLFVAPTTMHR